MMSSHAVNDCQVTPETQCGLQQGMRHESPRNNNVSSRGIDKEQTKGERGKEMMEEIYISHI